MFWAYYSANFCDYALVSCGQVVSKVHLYGVSEMLLCLLFSYIKKVIEDCNNSEETTKLLKFCCWENPHLSSSVLSELLWQVAYSYTYELRPYLDLLLQMLLLEDSWQNHRILNALKGRTVTLCSGKGSSILKRGNEFTMWGWGNGSK